MIGKLKNWILGSPLEGVARFVLRRPKIDFDTSGGYWERRYVAGGNSGPGSYGRLAEFKAEVLNAFVAENDIRSVIEFGCGDGNQLDLARYPSYVGVDVSGAAVAACATRFEGDATKSFLTTDDYDGRTAELSMSLDVLYHLVEDEIFESYMTDLFNAGTRFVIVYSSNHDDALPNVDHVRHRKFTDWTDRYRPDFKMIQHIPNKYPLKELNARQTSFADFYVFERTT